MSLLGAEWTDIEMGSLVLIENVKRMFRQHMQQATRDLRSLASLPIEVRPISEITLSPALELDISIESHTSIQH